MSKIVINHDICTLCEVCIQSCPFNAMENLNGKIEINSNCKVCSICVKNCPEVAISKVEEALFSVDKSLYKGVLVIGEMRQNELHPVTLELLGKAKELAKKINHPVLCLLYGENPFDAAHLCLSYGADSVYLLTHRELKFFRSDISATLISEALSNLKPSVVLIGATSIGRSLAPRIAATLKTGLTADCTHLDIKADTDLIQRRPAFGGNIMADILTTRHRPQMASVRYKVFNPISEIKHPKGTIKNLPISTAHLLSSINLLQIHHQSITDSITEAKRIIVAGVGVSDSEGLKLIHELADLLQASVAYTRPLIEKGLASYTHQIGLSGRTVQPELLITVGVSGSIQFIAGMEHSEHIIAINTDPNADIMKVAHMGVVGNAYDILPQWIDALKEGAYRV
ncbi:MAG: electron transfer flavoprotein alpha subunit [Erysipelotrichaceae bacterium]|nr:MAG: electron transfer flavoprotein alpha [Erysipelotrichaceae bacterium]TXT17141.1 MAG: electron transfer flavoprotein alpha subunit [Erysipelotrichaceae bacterium]